MNKTSLQQLISVLVLAAPLVGMTLPSAAADEPKRDPSITIKPGAVFSTTQNTRFDQIFLYDPGNRTFNDFDPSWPTVAPQTGFAMNVYPTSGVLVNGKASGYPATVISGSWSFYSLGTDQTSFADSYLSPAQGYAYGPAVTFQYGWYTSYGSGGAAGAEYPIYLWGLHSATIPILQEPPNIYTNGPVAGCINDSALSGCFSGPGDIYKPNATVTLGSGTHPTTNDPKLTVSSNGIGQNAGSTLTIEKLDVLRGAVSVSGTGILHTASTNLNGGFDNTPQSTATFTQTGGTHTTIYLGITDASYILSDGTLNSLISA